MGDQPLDRSPRWLGPIAEVLVACLTAAIFPLLCAKIVVNPLDRLGQVSGLAAMEFRYTLAATALIVALVIAARRRAGLGFDMTARLVCAAVAGLATGLVAGGVVVALRGTPFGLNGSIGDVRNLAMSADAIRAGDGASSVYPPLSLHVLAWYADLFDLWSLHAIKHLQIIGTAALGPAAYLSWRLLFRPAWALGIGVTAALPLIEAGAYKPYGQIVLIVFIPVVVRFLQVLRDAGDRSPASLARCGVAFGAAFGVLCLLYSGWFKWSLPGLVVAGLVLFPWRHWRKGLLMTALVVVVFAVIAGPYIYRVLTDLGALDDGFIYPDALIEPTYIAMFGGEPPATMVWPPMGELGGVGLFTLLLVAGLGVAIALGRRRTLVITLGSTIVGAWLLRFWYAHLMYKTKLVQLYPRTTAEILYCLLVLSGFAIFLVIERVKKAAPADSPLRSPSALIGAVCALLLLFGSAGSAIANRYMPSESAPMSFGILAWNSHHASL